VSAVGTIFTTQPWLALVPAAVFLVLYRLSARRLPAFAASAWLLYAVYEYAMQRRWLCTGECDIRIDLLLLYPVLLLTSIAAVIVALLGIFRRRPPVT